MTSILNRIHQIAVSRGKPKYTVARLIVKIEIGRWKVAVDRIKASATYELFIGHLFLPTGYVFRHPPSIGHQR